MSRRASTMIGEFESITNYVDLLPYSRQCTHCGVTKLIDDFGKNGVDEEGNPEYRKECKVCYNTKRKENRTKNKHAEFIGHQRHRGEEDIQYTYSEWRECVIYFGGECAYCGRTTRKGERLTRDHLVPVSLGGKTEQGNIVPACKTCNCSKGNKDFREWLMSQPFFSQERLNRIFKWRTIIRAAGGGEDDE